MEEIDVPSTWIEINDNFLGAEDIMDTIIGDTTKEDGIHPYVSI